MAAHELAVDMTDHPWRLSGRRVREARRARGWSQVQLAQASGVHQTTVSKIELEQYGERGPGETARRLATALGIAMADLLVTDEEAPAGAGEVGLKPTDVRSILTATLPLDVRRIPIWGSLPRSTERTPKPTGGILPVVAPHLTEPTGRLVAFAIDDESCVPHATVGEWAIVDRDHPPQDGRFHVIAWHGEWVIRQLRLVAGNFVRVIDGDAQTSPVPLSQVPVLGVVIWFEPPGGREAP